MAEFLALRDIVKIYGTTARTTALRGVSLSLAAGEYAALIGRSGSGKSTLLNIIGTLDRPTSGEMRVDGRDIFALDDDGRAAFRGRTIGFVFQFHHLLPEFTALENVLLPFRAAHGRTTAALRPGPPPPRAGVGVGDRMNHKSNALSGGRQQRVAVARAPSMNRVSSWPTSRPEISTPNRARPSRRCCGRSTGKAGRRF